MGIVKAQFERAKEVAFRLNRDLPVRYQSEILFEEMRVHEEVVNAKGLENRRVLLVGGAGYIGSVLTGYLLDHGYRVRCLDLLLYDNHGCVLPYLSHPNYEFLRGDLADRSRTDQALETVTDVVLLAGLVGDPITKKYPELSQRINHDGMIDLVSRLVGRGLNKVVFISTCSNYGLIEENVAAGEDFELNPLSLYAKAKVAVEKEILSLKGRADFHPTVLRFATAFGLSPRMRFDLTVSEFTREMFLGRDLLVYDSETWRPYCHVKDFSLVIRRVLEAPAKQVSFEVFNAGGDVNNRTKQMIVDEIKRHLPGAKVRYKEHGSDPRNYRVDFSKIRKRLYFDPVSTVSDGIGELIAAMRQGLFEKADQFRNFYGNNEIFL
jgi:nucleoside-diphosphate-sugar epimerase